MPGIVICFGVLCEVGLNLRLFGKIVEELTQVRGLDSRAGMVYIQVVMRHPASISNLAAQLGMTRKVLSFYCHELEKAGWLKFVKEGRLERPSALVPIEVEKRLASLAREGIDMALYKGERTLGTFFDWIVAPFVNLLFNARPEFLTKADTKQRLELDFFAPDYAWGSEYQGEQHRIPTQLFPDVEDFKLRKHRDRMKATLCEKHNVRLTEVDNYSLSLPKVLRAIPEHIPRRSYDPAGPFVQMLDQAGKDVSGAIEWDRE